MRSGWSTHRFNLSVRHYQVTALNAWNPSLIFLSQSFSLNQVNIYLEKKNKECLVIGASSFSSSSGHQRYSSLIEVKKQKGLQKWERGPEVLHEQWTSIKATVSLISLIGWIFLTWFVLGFCVFFWELVSCYNGKALWQTLPSPPLTTSISWMASSDSPGHSRKYFRIPVNFQKLPEISHNCWLANWNSLVSSQVELKLNFFLFLRLSL